MKNTLRRSIFSLIVVSIGLAACQSAPENRTPPKNRNIPAGSDLNRNAETLPVNSAENISNQAKKENGHEHTAPHGGTLIAFGEEFAHLELVLAADNGLLTAYALDGEAEKSVMLEQAEIEIKFEKPKKFSLKLSARENSLTGEKKGATSEFRGGSDELKNVREFDAEISFIKFRGREFKNTHFNFPNGNENDHGH